MARPIWSGSISFGLVYIPVQMYSAVREERISFHMMSSDGSCRLRRKLVCPETGTEYEYQQTALGYEIAPDQYVIVGREDFEKLKPETLKSINIERFVELPDIDPVYFDRTYYLGPDEGGEKPYRLLAEAMQETGRVAVARFVMREREYLAALRVIEGIIGLETLHYHAEISGREEIRRAAAGAKIDRRELVLAQQLIEQLTGKFDPEQYRDEYRDRVREMLEAKAKGQKIAVSEAPARRPQIIDITEALKRSLRGRKPESARKRPRVAARPREAVAGVSKKPRKKRGSARSSHRASPAGGSDTKRVNRRNGER